ncbi:peptide-methionine (S)-S-oxide reductase [Paenibacillus humicola]|uniref:peptide-methionine (S)-S-oxide reductase n=1 Tax=Paenibacillus humicola TaxID=3110540 RepID=UPI00237A1409|nr:peptide-methionine (S)-S-oxide reductase [Paenibacillus humicola]
MEYVSFFFLTDRPCTTRVGYAGGTQVHPTYRQLGDHTETVEMDYDTYNSSYLSEQGIGTPKTAHAKRAAQEDNSRGSIQRRGIRISCLNLYLRHLRNLWWSHQYSGHNSLSHFR